jgi:hypothetical protein
VLVRNARNAVWYREEAARLRNKAAAANDSPELGDSYLALAIEYERLAQILEQAALFPRTHGTENA